MMTLSPLQPAPADPKHATTYWTDLYGASSSLAIATLAQQQSHPVLVITTNTQQAQQLLEELEFFQAPTTHYLADWETLPFDHFSPHEDLTSTRLLTLYKLLNMQQGIIIASLSTLMHRLPPKSFLQGNTFVLKQGELLDFDKLRQQLVAAGYRHVKQVMTHGEFAVRGSIIDLFPMGSRSPFRIDLFDNTIDSIRSFDPDSQRSLERLADIQLLPAREYPLTNDSITHFRQSWREQFSGNPKECPIYDNISQGVGIAGIEYYLPLFFEQLATIFDYLPDNTQIITIGNQVSTAGYFWQEVTDRHEQLQHDITRPLCKPSHMFIPVDEFFGYCKQQPIIQIYPEKNRQGHVYACQPPPTLNINAKAAEPLALLENFIAQAPQRILICAESTGRRETLLELFASTRIRPKQIACWQDFLNDDACRLAITVAPLTRGLLSTNPAIAIISESQLFGEHVMQRRLRQQRQQDPNALIKNLTELSIGSPVVHLNYGIARYCGLKILTTGDIEAEYLTLEYANDDKIYVPITSLDLISRYTGVDADHVSLTRLGSKQWEKIRDRAAKKIRDVAAELLDIHSRRQAAPGFAFPAPDQHFQQFRQAFPFEETPDQRNAIDDVIQDMTQARSMDRLICGDVGFGKTEVAMQAAFLAIQGDKQVAILVPTTLLANQHLQTFQDRFADWPIKIAGLSRLQTKSQQDQALSDMQTGKLDIVIGTHKLLSDNIKFTNLGLLIVDEEHRFGVRQKERIKSLRAHVDILTLTATPIPRTLNMAFAGTRDLSIISTPPARRLAVKTFLHENSDSITREAILREIMRGGQVYYLHNNVATIRAEADKIQKIIPDANIGIAHGQMRERDLEHTMADFYHQRFNVLLCSTIIESGIDVPTANTILINRSDLFGLAQLHQLRGRVGRSHHQAYAYLLHPHKSGMTKDAQKRLEAISAMEDLGAGFQLATHDLEIRGAGELLGDEQSGHMQAIGFTLYMELLNEAVKALKEGREPGLAQPLEPSAEIDLQITALIPDSYVFDVQQRLTLYKRLSSCGDADAIQQFKEEIIDRFGLLPEATEHLIAQNRLKLTARELGIKKINATKEFGYLNFNSQPKIKTEQLFKLIQEQADTYQLQGPQKLRYRFTDPLPATRISMTRELLDKLTA